MLHQRPLFFSGYNQVMVIELDVVFQNGVLRPVEPLSLSENQRLHATITDVPATAFNPRTAEFQWLEQHRNEFRGQWVALEGSDLLSHGADARQVRDEARSKGVRTPLLVHVPEDDLLQSTPAQPELSSRTKVLRPLGPRS